MRGRPLVVFVVGFVAAVASCTTFNDLNADPDLVGGGSQNPSGTCKNPPCVVAPDGTILGGGKGAECTTGADCASTVCQESACTDASSLDGVKNGTETDVDCGGTAPTNAPKCLANKVCKIDDDCHWGKCTNNVCGDDVKGVKDGDQTDVDCGGTASPACDWTKGCQFDRDCQGTTAGTTGSCGPDHTCLIGPSCATVHGGTTCGTGEFGDQGKQHETCCKSLLVTGFEDSKNPGKKVYLDKYEITGGRMRAFLESIAKTDPNQAPNVKAWITAHPPARWNKDWTDLMPEGWEEGQLNFTTAQPTADLNYPGNDQMPLNPPNESPTFQIRDGAWEIDTGLNFMLGAPHYFPEFINTATSGTGPPADPDYAAGHNLNCVNSDGSYGFSTFWFDDATVQNFSGGVKKAYTKDVMDEKALNCAPFGLLAAFCAWDGGQLMTDEVFDFVAGGPWPANPAAADATPPPRLTGGNTVCGPTGAPDTLNTTSDGTLTCDNVYQFPDPATGGDFDGSSRVAPPGRVPGDVVRLAAGDEPWMDLIGNLNEGVFRKDGQFSFRGYGLGWSSIQAHRTQQTTPRYKTASFGARCMRFRDTVAQ